MMTKKKTSRLLGVKFMWTLPVLALLLFAFAEPSYRTAETILTANNNKIQEIERKNVVKVEGLVLDENNKPLPGTSVVIKGTTIGTVCDIDGKFILEVPENASIVMSFVGKKTVTDTYKGITSAYKKDGVFNRKYNMEVEVIYASARFDTSEIAPPPPPKSKNEKLVPPPPPKVVEMPLPPMSNGEKEIFFVVEDMPAFPGGSRALSRYIQNLTEKYDFKGKAKIGFTVNANGKVADIKIVDNDTDKIGQTAAEIIGKLPNWKPGSQRGKPVPVVFVIIVEFK